MYTWPDVKVTISFEVDPELLHDMRSLVATDGEEDLFNMLKEEIEKGLPNFPNKEFKFYYDKAKYEEYIKDKPKGCMW